VLQIEIKNTSWVAAVTTTGCSTGSAIEIAVRRPRSMYSSDNCGVLNFPFTIANNTHDKVLLQEENGLDGP